MKAIILAGGKGTRLMEETDLRPKPMVEIGGKPILWHIMKIYSAHGVNDFVVCLGHKGYMIKEYFSNFFLHHSDVSFDLEKGTMAIHRTEAEPWRVTLVDTGEESLTAKRIAMAAAYIDDENFCMTYGDGVGDIDISAQIQDHLAKKKAATVTLCQPPGRFGSAVFGEGDAVCLFQEKPLTSVAWISAGFFVLNRSIFELAKFDRHSTEMFEQRPLADLAKMGQLNGWKHAQFWQPMDTLREKIYLETLWNEGNAPWKIWK